MMSRITTLKESDSRVSVMIEGQLVGKWVGKLEKVCRRRLAQNKRICLELSKVTFVDSKGIELLIRLIGQQVEIRCAPLIRTLLNESLSLDQIRVNGSDEGKTH